MKKVDLESPRLPRNFKLISKFSYGPRFLWLWVNYQSKVDLCHNMRLFHAELKIFNIFLTVPLNKWTMWLTFIFWNDFSYWKPLIPFLICSAFAFLKCHTFRSYEGGKTTLKLNIANTFLQWQFWCKEDWKSYSGRPFFSNIGFSWISSSSPKRDVIPLILVPL